MTVFALIWFAFGVLATAYVTTRRWKHIADIDEPGAIYLSRLFLVKTRLLGVYLHVIRRPDYARCSHDHPWPFVTVILAGGYEEEVAGKLAGKLYVRRPGYVGYRPKAFEHRITRLLTARALTLVIRGPDSIEWGFRLRSGRKVSWQEYIKLPGSLRVLWCADEKEKA
jgi:hypothetical protein